METTEEAIRQAYWQWLQAANPEIDQDEHASAEAIVVAALEDCDDACVIAGYYFTRFRSLVPALESLELSRWNPKCPAMASGAVKAAIQILTELVAQIPPPEVQRHLRLV